MPLTPVDLPTASLPNSYCLRDGDEIKPSFPRRRESSSSASLPCWIPAFAGMTHLTNAGLISSPPLSNNPEIISRNQQFCEP